MILAPWDVLKRVLGTGNPAAYVIQRIFAIC